MSFFDDASLAFLPSGGAGKDGKAYSIKPTDGTGDFTFSRGSNLTATRVGPTGLIEKGRENLFTYSNDFSNAAWSKNNTSVTSGQSGYDGSSDAWLLEKSAADGTLLRFITLNSVQTISFYAKANTLNWFRLRIGTAGANAYFDLQNGVVGSSSGVSSAIESVGNGWYRCSVTDSYSSDRYRIYPADGDNDTSGTSGSIYIQDAQLELGLAATDYIESGASTGKAGLLENEPRFDYSGGATCPSLLLEPSRTNLIDYSEYFGSVWSLSNINLTYNHSTSPEGLQNATLMQPTTNDAYLREMSNSFISGNTYVASIYLKSNSGSNFDLDFRLRESGGGQNVTETKTITTEWQRFEISLTATITGTYQFWIGTSGTWSLGEDLLIWGAQLEAGSYPTSYIPNHSGGSATRTGEKQVVTGLTSSVLNQTEGSIYLELQTSEDGFFTITSYPDGVAGDTMRLSFTNVITFSLISSGIAPLSKSINPTLSKVKVVGTYSGTELKLCVNGGTIEKSSGNFSFSNQPTKIQTHGYIDFLRLFANVNQALYFPTALSDADCISLTTL